MNKFLTVLFIVLIINNVWSQKNDSKLNWKKVKVLVYTKNGKGYVHENIPSAVACFEKLGKQYGFQTVVSDDPSLFNTENLKTFTLLVFTSTNNDVFDTDDQRLAFRQYIEAGGGFVGVHSALGTERNWTWFKMMLGGTFAWHPKFQRYKLQVIDPKHPSMSGVPNVWDKSDECYFQKELYPGINTVLAHDLTTIVEDDQEKIKASAGMFNKYYPAAWYHNYDGGIVWITALGHDKKDYEEPTYVNHLFQGLKFVATQVKEKDYSRSYAKHRDDQIKF